MKPEYKLERPLGFLEWVFWLLENVGRTNFVVVAEITGALTDDALHQALAAVQARHPLLRIGIGWVQRSGLAFRSGGVPPIPLRVLNGPREAWIVEAERDREEPLPIEQGPLARCTLLRHSAAESTLLTTVSHVIGDGISGSYLVRDILRAAGAAGATQALDPE